MRIYCWISLLVLVVLPILSGCKVGPNYPGPPDTPVSAATWTEPESEEIKVEPADLCRWWEEFNDPAMSQLISTSVQNSPTLRQAAYRIVQARAQLGTIRADLFPQVDSDALLFHSKTPAFNPIPGVRLVRDTWSWGMNANWEIDVFGRLRRLVESAEADICVTVEDYRNTMIILMADVARNYVDARSFQQRIAVVKKSIAIQYETLKLAEKKKAIGTGATALDVAQARANYKSTESDLPPVELGYRLAVNRLSVLLGTPPGTVDEMMKLRREDLVGEGPADGTDAARSNQTRLEQLLATPLKRVIPLPPERLTVGIPADLLRRRPDIRAIEQQIAAQNARIGAAVGLLYPIFSISGTFGLDANNFNHLFTSGGIGAGVGPSVRWNILNFGKFRCNIAVQRAATQELVELYQDTVLRAAEEVDGAIATYVNEKERAVKLREAVAAYEKAADLSWKMYIIGSGGQEGKIDVFQRMLDSQRALLISQNQLVVAEATVTNSVIALYRAMGGGWWCPPDAVEEVGAPVTEGSEPIIQREGDTEAPDQGVNYPMFHPDGGPVEPTGGETAGSEKMLELQVVSAGPPRPVSLRNRLLRVIRSQEEPQSQEQVDQAEASVAEVSIPRMILTVDHIE